MNINKDQISMQLQKGILWLPLTDIMGAAIVWHEKNLLFPGKIRRSGMKT